MRVNYHTTADFEYVVRLTDDSMPPLRVMQNDQILAAAHSSEEFHLWLFGRSENLTLSVSGESEQEIYFEQVMLKGMIIGNLKIEFEEWIRYIDQFVPKITNWSICDSFCSSLKITKKYSERMWEFIKKYAEKEEEFSARFGFVMILNYFIEENYLEEVFELLENIKSEAYYAKMAAAWVLSVCYAQYPERTIKFLEKGKLDRQIFQKALQKILESNRVKEEQKIRIREMKKEKRDF